MTFTQSDFRFTRTKYVIESIGIRITRKKLFSNTHRFIDFENIGSKVSIEKSQKYFWLSLSAGFLILAIAVFINRMNGGKVGDGAEVFHLSMCVLCFAVYSLKSKNIVSLSQVGNNEKIDFTGAVWYNKRVLRFINLLIESRDNYLDIKYSKMEGLSAAETILCMNANLPPEDGLFFQKRTRCSIKKLVFENEYSDKVKPGAIYYVTTEQKAREIIHECRDKLISEGKYIFIFDQVSESCKLGVTGATSNPYKVMEYAETNGINYDIETKDIIEKCKKWDKQFGLKLVGIGPDFCEGEIVSKDVDYKALADEIYAFCPDVVDQGTGTVELLADDLRETRRIFLWWD